MENSRISQYSWVTHYSSRATNEPIFRKENNKLDIMEET
jgi:hypothetical protein